MLRSMLARHLTMLRAMVQLNSLDMCCFFVGSRVCVQALRKRYHVFVSPEVCEY